MSGDEWQIASAVILDETGLHARPAVKLTKLAKKFTAAIELQGDDKDRWVNAKSPNAVMKLRAGHNQPLTIRAQGSDATEALDALKALIARNFSD